MTSATLETRLKKFLQYKYYMGNGIIFWNAQLTDKGLYAIARSYYKLEYLNISYYRNISDKSLFEIAGNCHDLQEFYFAEARWITG
ncbi:1677_t:CDS:2 [Funneliformis geosporum]|uniref:1677_t:CDS:1 n=1 Tax=Funneliformis geosporum TaxID=1117311 RepID=A0A9W4WTZ4_9GLOM|nr:1677_t:CDS:2 [Funneliformis geosporum]